MRVSQPHDAAPRSRADTYPSGEARVKAHNAEREGAAQLEKIPERATFETSKFGNFLKFSLIFWDIKTPKLERHLMTNEKASSSPNRALMQLWPRASDGATTPEPKRARPQSMDHARKTQFSNICVVFATLETHTTPPASYPQDVTEYLLQSGDIEKISQSCPINF